MKQALPKMLAVIWYDSFNKSECSVDELKTLKDGSPRLTSGYLVRETSGAYFLAQTLDPEEDDFSKLESCDNVWVVPKVWVEKVITYQ